MLLVAFVLEGWSTLAAFKEFRAAKGELSWLEAIRRSKDPPAFIVLLENGAAMAGILAAALGLFLSQLTGNPFFDGAASIVIGIILGFTAMLLACGIQGAADRRGGGPGSWSRACAPSPRGKRGVMGVGHVLTVHSSPDQVTAMINVDFDDAIRAGQVEAIVCEIEKEAQRALAASPPAVHPAAAGREPRSSSNALD